ncbi:MAG: helix-turn-helix domain-containing protein [Firmicutes bacterium]|nr:helix-turn-helix domain-containing protein [Bacillota bacterium]
MSEIGKSKRQYVKMLIEQKDCALHWHDECDELILVIQGRCCITVLQDQYTIGENDFIFVNKSVVHKITCLDPNTVYLTLHINVFMYDDCIEKASKVFFVRDPKKMDTDTTEALTELRNIIAHIYLEKKYMNTSSEHRIYLYGKDLLTLLRNEFDYTKRNKSSQTGEGETDPIWECLDYMLDNHTSKITLDDLAKLVHLSPSYLSHRFKTFTEMSMEDWLYSFRLEEAVRQLISTDDSITKISYNSGFSDPRYFAKCFRKYFGTSPSEFDERRGELRYIEQEEIQNDYNIPRVNTAISAYLHRHLDSPADSESERLDITLELDSQKTEEIIDYQWKEILYVGDVYTMLSMSMFVEQIQRELGFRHIQIDYDEEQDAVAFDLLIPAIDVAVQTDTPVIIKLTGFTDPQNKIRSIQDELLKRYGQTGTLEWIIDEGKTNDSDLNSDNEYASCYGPARFIKDVLINNRHVPMQNLIESGDGKNESITSGLLTKEGFFTPLYFAYRMIVSLCPSVERKGPNYIVTRKDRRYDILVWHEPEDDLVDFMRIPEGSTDRKYLQHLDRQLELQINLLINAGDYVIKRKYYDVGESWYSAFLANREMVDKFSRLDIDDINRNLRLRVSFDAYKTDGEIKLSSGLKPGDIELFELWQFDEYGNVC